MATVTVYLTDSADDGEESTGGIWNDTASTDRIISSTFGCGFRFSSVGIAQGTTLTSAVITVYGSTNASASPFQVVTDVFCVDSDNAAAFSTTKPSAATLTTAKTTVTLSSTFTPNFAYEAYNLDVTTAVQEVLDRGGFSSGNAIAFVFKKVSVGTGKSWGIRDVETIMFDDEVYTKLVLTYEATGTNTQINIGDAWKSIDAMKVNIGDTWKDVTSAKINIGDVWKTIY